MYTKLPPGIPPVRFPGAELTIDVNLDGKPPPKSAQYPLNNSQLEELKKQYDFYRSREFLRPSASPYGSPVLFAPKYRDDKTFDGWRFCCDYRGVNKITITDAYTWPPIEILINQLQGARYFSKIDLTQFFHQIPIRKEDIHKTAITTRYGNFEWTVMPFGLKNAPATAIRFGELYFAPIPRQIRCVVHR